MARSAASTPNLFIVLLLHTRYTAAYKVFGLVASRVFRFSWSVRVSWHGLISNFLTVLARN